MRLRYSCGHEVDCTIHKDGLELIRLRFICANCRRTGFNRRTIVSIVGRHSFVIKLKRVRSPIGRGERLKIS